MIFAALNKINNERKKLSGVVKMTKTKTTIIKNAIKCCRFKPEMSISLIVNQLKLQQKVC